jgi:hypothetical protein
MVKEILDEFADVFSKKIDNDFHIKIQLEFTDLTENNLYQIEAKDGCVFVYNYEKFKPEQELALTTGTLKKLYDNELSPFNAFAQETYASIAPIEFINTTEEIYAERIKDENNEQFFPRFSKFHQFFSNDGLNKVIIDEKNCREMHGAKLIALSQTAYRKPFFQAFFSIKKDKIFYQTVPHECNIFVIRGKGKLKLDSTEYDVKENEYYNIKINKELLIENKEEESIDILYLGIRK